MSRSVLFGICFAAGIIAGILGTVLHGNIWIIGSAETGVILPWGAAFSLLLLLLIQLWAGTTAGTPGATLVVGIAAFSVATAAYIWPGADQLMIPFSVVAFQALPGAVIASLVWWLGSALITLVAMVAVKWILVADATASGSNPNRIGR